MAWTRREEGMAHWGKVACLLLAAYASGGIRGVAPREDAGSTALTDTPIKSQAWPLPSLSLSLQAPGTREF